MIFNNTKKRIFTSILLFSLLIIIGFSQMILIYSLIVLGILSVIEFNYLTKKLKLNDFYLIITNVSFITYIFIFCFLFFFFSGFIKLKIFLFILILVCAASDIGGFIFGRIIKGPKLSKISPNKTISGALGSIFLASLIMVLSIYLITDNINSLFIFIGIITSIFCQIGDLFFSFLKRKANIKDTGNFLPGHGGVLDRIDGMLLGIPVGFLSLILII